MGRVSNVTPKRVHSPALVVLQDGSRHFRIENNTLGFDDFDRQYFNVSGYFGEHSPHTFAAAPKLLEALKGVMSILGRAESNASGNPEWDYVGARIAAARAAIAEAEVRS